MNPMAALDFLRTNPNRHADVIAIPKAGDPLHVQENRAALDVRLSERDLADLDRAFPPPAGPRPLEMI